MNVFDQFKNENKLDAAQLDSLVIKAFIILTDKYNQFNLSYNEDGVLISNFENCTDEESGGWTKYEVESNLTDELLKIANKLV